MTDNKSKWQASAKLTGDDAVSEYLKRHFLYRDPVPSQIRRYTDGAEEMLICQFISADGDETAYQVSELKAGLHRMIPGKVPLGGAVRLGNSQDTMGIGLDLEDCLAASILDEVVVWATLKPAYLMRWKCPDRVKNLIIYGENDSSYEASHAAYSLAYRLTKEEKQVDVRFPPEGYETWGEVLSVRQSEQIRAELNEAADRIFTEPTVEQTAEMLTN